LKVAEHEAAVRDTVAADYARLPAWYAYVQFEEERAAPRARLRALYERAVVKFFLVGELWERYAAMASSLWSPTDAIVLRIRERAVRNVSWLASPWRALIELQTRAHVSPSVVEDTLERSVGVALQSLSEYATAFDTAINYSAARLRDTARTNSDAAALATLVDATREWCARASACFAANARADTATARAAALGVALVRARFELDVVCHLPPPAVAAASASAAQQTVCSCIGRNLLSRECRSVVGCKHWWTSCNIVKHCCGSSTDCYWYRLGLLFFFAVMTVVTCRR
jgi:hypothetical protein